MATTSEIEDFLKKEVSILLRLDNEVEDASVSFEQLGITSLSFVELMISIENKYGVSLISKGVSQADLSSIASLARRIEKEL